MNWNWNWNCLFAGNDKLLKKRYTVVSFADCDNLDLDDGVRVQGASNEQRYN